MQNNTTTYFSTRNMPTKLKDQAHRATVTLRQRRGNRRLAIEQVVFEAIALGLPLLLKGRRECVQDVERGET